MLMKLQSDLFPCFIVQASGNPNNIFLCIKWSCTGLLNGIENPCCFSERLTGYIKLVVTWNYKNTFDKVLEVGGLACNCYIRLEQCVMIKHYLIIIIFISIWAFYFFELIWNENPQEMLRWSMEFNKFKWEFTRRHFVVDETARGLFILLVDFANV